jgi:hypothetical protein
MQKPLERLPHASGIPNAAKRFTHELLTDSMLTVQLFFAICALWSW